MNRKTPPFYETLLNDEDDETICILISGDMINGDLRAYGRSAKWIHEHIGGNWKYDVFCNDHRLNVTATFSILESVVLDQNNMRLRFYHNGKFMFEVSAF